MRAAGEAADVTDVAEQPGGTGRSDAVQVEKSAAGGGDEFGEFLLRDLIFLSMTTSSWISSEASQRRVLPTTSRGRTVASRARACWADRSFLAPPATSSSSKWCRRETISVRARPS